MKRKANNNQSTLSKYKKIEAISSNSNFDLLPNDVVLLIFRKLSIPFLQTTISLVCKKFYFDSKNSNLWYLVESGPWILSEKKFLKEMENRKEGIRYLRANEKIVKNKIIGISLKALYVSDGKSTLIFNQTVGILPEIFSLCPNITHFAVRSNYTDNLIEPISMQNQLRYLDIGGSHGHSSIQKFTQLHNLESLFVGLLRGDNDRFSDIIKSNPKLKNFSMISEKINFSEIVNMERVSVLLQNATIPGIISELKKLQPLWKKLEVKVFITSLSSWDEDVSNCIGDASAYCKNLESVLFARIGIVYRESLEVECKYTEFQKEASTWKMSQGEGFKSEDWLMEEIPWYLR